MAGSRLSTIQHTYAHAPHSSCQASHMNSAFIYSFIIGVVGAALFLFVDKYEHDGMVANLLKFLVLVVGGVAILHKLKPFGLALF
jgi:hypothetical protein